MLWAAGAAVIAVWLITLGTRSLISPDEGRYATLSLEMLASGDWITPHLNGLLYFEKPPLQYWGGALAMAIFGVNEFAARLWPGLAGLATVGLVGFSAFRLWGHRVGWLALFIAGGTSWLVLSSHFLTLDMGLCAALTLVLVSVLLAAREEESPVAQRPSPWWLVAWAGIALAVLSKGLVGLVIPGGALFVATAVRRDFSIWRRLRWGAGVPLLLAITLPWFIAVSIRNPGFAHFFFIHEHFQRYLTHEAHRVGPWWYFIPILLVGFLPWSSALPWLVRRANPGFSETLLWSWAWFVFVFFSASGSKLPSYILPMFPPLCLLLAARIGEASTVALRRHLLVPAAAWTAALIASTQLPRLVPADTPAAAASALSTGIAVAALIFIAAAVAAWRLLGRDRTTAAIGLVAMAQLLAALCVLQSHNRYGQLKSSVKIAEALQGRIDRDTPVYAIEMYDQSLPFYLRRPVTLVAYRDEFAFGEDHEPSLWIPTLSAFAARWAADPHAVAYLGVGTLQRLRREGLTMREVYRDSRRVVVVKP